MYVTDIRNVKVNYSSIITKLDQNQKILNSCVATVVSNNNEADTRMTSK